MQTHLIAGVALALMLAAGSTSTLAAATAKPLTPPQRAVYIPKQIAGRIKSGPIYEGTGVLKTRNMPASKALKGKTAQDSWDKARMAQPTQSARKTISVHLTDKSTPNHLDGDPDRPIVCSAKAKTIGLTGKARSSFMSTCLKGGG